MLTFLLVVLAWFTLGAVAVVIMLYMERENKYISSADKSSMLTMFLFGPFSLLLIGIFVPYQYYKDTVWANPFYKEPKTKESTKQ